MPRLMSVAMTEDAVRARTKTVTRRKGWWVDKHGRRLAVAGDRVTLCRKVMGRKPGEPLERICDVEIVSIRREPLGLLSGHRAPRGLGDDYPEREVAREGFPGMRPSLFVSRFFVDAQGILPTENVTRIEWRYLDCSTCEGTGRVMWEPFAQRDTEDDDQPCPDCCPRR